MSLNSSFLCLLSYLLLDSQVVADNNRTFIQNFDNNTNFWIFIQLIKGERREDGFLALKLEVIY